MKNIRREVPIKMELDCFKTIFDSISAAVFVTVKRRTFNIPGLRTFAIEATIFNKIENDV